MKIKKRERDWLLLKELDQYAKSPEDRFPQGSVLSGLTVDDLKSGPSPKDALPAGPRGPARADAEPSLDQFKVMKASPGTDARQAE